MSEGRSLNAPRSSASWITPSPASYCRSPLRTSAFAFSSGSEMSDGSSAQLSRRSSLPSGIFFTRELFRLAIHHFTRDAVVLECRVAENEGAALLLAVLGRCLGCLRRREQGRQFFAHRAHSRESPPEPIYRAPVHNMPNSGQPCGATREILASATCASHLAFALRRSHVAARQTEGRSSAI